MELSLNDFVFGVLLGTLILIGLIGLVSRFLHWKKERDLKSLVVVCRLCGHVFLNPKGEDLLGCEVCDAVNLGKGNGKLG